MKVRRFKIPGGLCYFEKMETEKPDEENDQEESDDSSWEQDQKKRGYYYDDAHGYEIYNPEEDEDEDEN